MNENKSFNGPEDEGRKPTYESSVPVKDETRFVVDDSQASQPESQSINAGYWDNVPVVKNSPTQRASSPEFVIPNEKQAEQKNAASPPEKGGKMVRLIMFAVAATLISLFMQFLFETYQVMQPCPNPNALALGTTAKVHGTVTVPIQPPCELDFLTQKQIVEMRTNFVNQHPELLATKYLAFGPVWGSIGNNLPWWGLKGYYWNSQGDHNEEGPSLVGSQVSNPFVLTQPEFEHGRQWIDGNPDNKNFVFTCLPTDIKWTPDKALVEETIDLTDFFKHYRQQGGTSDFKPIATAIVNDYNAYDMGFSWKSISVKGGAAMTPGVVRINSFLHQGKTMGIPCNNMGTLEKTDWNEYELKPGTDIEVKLWRNRPSDANSTPDATNIWHIK